MRSIRAPVRRAYEQPAAVEQFKEDGSAITALDRELEQRLAPRLLALDPTFGLWSEEGGWLREGTPCWHLDPVDGTANFARRLGHFASQVVLMDGDVPLFGAIYEPLMDDYAWAARGLGTHRAGRRVRVSERPPAASMVHLDISDDGLFVGRENLLARVRLGVYKVRALGSVGLHLRDVACGSVDAYLGARSSPSPLHDLGPGVLLVREAGGRATNGAGGDALADRRCLVAGGQPVHDWLVSLLAMRAS